MEQDRCVVFTYSKPVGGYEVKVFWRPHELTGGYLIGPAILEFKHEDPDRTFSVTNNHFGLVDSAEWTKAATIVDGYFVKTRQPQAILDYETPEIADRLPSTSFFFVDLDFGGKRMCGKEGVQDIINALKSEEV